MIDQLRTLIGVHPGKAAVVLLVLLAVIVLTPGLYALLGVAVFLAMVYAVIRHVRQ